MSLFKDMLKSDESLFKNEAALDYDYLPKILPFREQQQRHIASCIKPLFDKRNGKNLFIYGAPGIGKTAATRHVLRDLEDETDEIIPIYINCWTCNSSYKIMLDICDKIGYKFTQNKKTEELFRVVKQILNKSSAVFAFDEVDKADDLDFMYMIMEDIFRKTILMITNYSNWLNDMDARIKSRLMAELLLFKPYNAVETKSILRQRREYAFVAGVWDENAFDIIAAKAAELEDIRSGLHMMRESANIAEEKSSKDITIEHVNEAIRKVEDFTCHTRSDLNKDEQLILGIVKSNSGCKIGDIFKSYQQNGGNLSYKTFQRKIKKLENAKFVTASKIEGGSEGMTSIIKIRSVEKKLDEY